MPGDILDLIDSALEDCSASDDAMRWNPERVICDGGRPLQPERWSPWRHGTWGYTVTVIDATGEAVEGATVELGPASPVTSREWWYSPFEQDPGVSAAEVEDFRKQIAEAYGFACIGGELHYHAPDAPRRITRRCPLCNPRGNPRRLAADGREYARRRKARKRR